MRSCSTGLTGFRSTIARNKGGADLSTVQDQITSKGELANFGVVREIYPAMTVSTGDRFQAVIAYPNKQPGCNVVFAFGYIVRAGRTQNIGTWAESYDGTVQTLDVSLLALQGQQIPFVLTLFAEQAPSQNEAYWVNPRNVL